MMDSPVKGGTWNRPQLVSWEEGSSVADNGVCSDQGQPEVLGNAHKANHQGDCHKGKAGRYFVMTLLS